MREKLNTFLNSDFFIWVIALLVGLVWGLKVELVGLICLAVLACTFLLANRIRPAISLLVLVSFAPTFTQIPGEYNRGDIQLGGDYLIGLILLVAAFTAAVICCAVRLVKSRKELPKQNSLSDSFVVCMLVMLLSGAFTEKFNFAQNLFSLSAMAAPFAVYLLFRLDRAEGFDRFIAKLIFAAGVLVSAELCVYYCGVDSLLSAMQNKAINLGWGISNNIATVQAMGAVAVCYVYVRNKNWGYLVGAGLVAVAMLFTFSRGNILAFAMLFPFLVVALFVYGSQKKTTAIVLGGFAVLLAAAVVWQWDFLTQAFEKLVERGFSDSGRRLLWGQYLGAFAQNPLLGNGYYETNGMLAQPHAAMIILLNGSGICGMLAFLYHYYKRYRVLFTHKGALTAFAALTVFPNFFYSCTDMNFFMTYDTMMVLGILEACVKQTDAARNLKCLYRWKEKTYVAIFALGVVLAVFGFVYAANAPYETPNGLTISYGSYLLIFGSFAAAAYLTIPVMERFFGKRERDLLSQPKTE